MVVFFFNDTATTEIYTLSLHDALPISPNRRGHAPQRRGSHGAAAAPRRETLPEAPAQSSERLKQVEAGCEQPARERRGGGRIRKRGSRRAHARLRQGYHEAEDQQREGEPERAPGGTQRGNPKQDGGDEMPLGHLGQRAG